MKKYFLSFAVLTGSVAFAAKPDTLVQYLEIQTKLANDDFSGIPSLASKIAKNEKGSKTEELAKNLSKTKNIEQARTQFKALSKEVIASTSKKDLGELKVASCPMAEAKWIQKESEVKNPYYGSSMLDCGAIEH